MVPSLFTVKIRSGLSFVGMVFTNQYRAPDGTLLNNKGFPIAFCFPTETHLLSQ